jgi:hypothetical protein
MDECTTCLWYEAHHKTTTGILSRGVQKIEAAKVSVIRCHGFTGRATDSDYVKS